jgi:hypothetical protein
MRKSYSEYTFNLAIIFRLCASNLESLHSANFLLKFTVFTAFSWVLRLKRLVRLLGEQIIASSIAYT